MTRSVRWFEKLNWFSESIGFFKTHFLTIFSLGLVAAFGRAIQLGAFGPISTVSHILLEIIIEATRILIFLYALGLTNVRAGATRLMQLFTNLGGRRRNWTVGWQQLKKNWWGLPLNLIAFMLLAWFINLLIDYTAYQTCLYVKLKANQIIAEQASEWTIILFFKNISVIPFTLVYNALFLLWVTNRLKSRLH